MPPHTTIYCYPVWLPVPLYPLLHYKGWTALSFVVGCPPNIYYPYIQHDTVSTTRSTPRPSESDCLESSHYSTVYLTLIEWRRVAALPKQTPGIFPVLKLVSCWRRGKSPKSSENGHQSIVRRQVLGTGNKIIKDYKIWICNLRKKQHVAKVKSIERCWMSDWALANYRVSLIRS